MVTDKTFRTERHRTTFELEKIEDSSDPEKVLRECFKIAIEEAMQKSKENIGWPDKIGLSLITPQLETGSM